MTRAEVIILVSYKTVAIYVHTTIVSLSFRSFDDVCSC